MLYVKHSGILIYLSNLSIISVWFLSNFVLFWQANGITNADECPRVESPSSATEVVVHSGESKQIAVRAINLKVR
jgi:hypothetical protein